MRARVFLLALFVAAFAAAAGADQVRLRTGDLLQGEIREGSPDEEGFAFLLYRTGGVFRLRWDQLIEDDEQRLREQTGFSAWEENEVPLIPGHQITLTTGAIEVGLAENPDETSRDLILRKATGTRTYPRDRISSIKQIMVEALEIYTSDELYEQYLEKISPEAPGDHLEIAKLCVQVDAVRQAKEHLDIALADEEFNATEKGQQAKGLLTKVDVLVRAEDARAKKREIRRMAFHNRYDDALAGIDDLANEYRESPAILKVLKLEKLRRETVSSRRKYFRRVIRGRFFRTLDQLIKAKIREKDENDEPISIQAVKVWASNPRGLGAEIFQDLASYTGLDEKEAREFWDNRTPGQIRRYNYGPATFIHPEVRERSQRAMSAQKSTGGSSSGSRGRGRSSRASSRKSGGPKLMSEQDWWKAQKSSEVKKDFVLAWFAEMGGGVLQVIRIENRNCKTCGGKGVKTSQSINTSETIRTVCSACNFAGHERIVICR